MTEACIALSSKSGEMLEYWPNEILMCREGNGRRWAISRWGVPAADK